MLFIIEEERGKIKQLNNKFKFGGIVMSDFKLEYLRNIIHSMLASEDYNSEELLNKSRELDSLILSEMREKYPIENKINKRMKIDMNIFNCGIGSLEKMYDSMILVDPVSKETIVMKLGKLKVKDMTCYSFWEKYQSCDNCISIKDSERNEAILFLFLLCKDLFV